MSLFAVNKYKVIKACQIAIKEVREEQGAIRENYIDAYMKRKWFKPKTREEAWKMVEKDWCSQIFCPIPPKTEDRANDLLEACEIAEGEFVQLDTRDAEFVKKWSD